MTRKWAACAIVVALAQFPFAASAQRTKLKHAAKPVPAPTVPAPPKPLEPAPEPSPPPYEPKLLRLSEILGTLTYMRNLCGADDAERWRKQMAELMAAEGDTPERKERLAGAFNRGFRGYEVTYRSCTNAARAIIERAFEEGEHITREVASRYAG